MPKGILTVRGQSKLTSRRTRHFVSKEEKGKKIQSYKLAAESLKNFEIHK